MSKLATRFYIRLKKSIRYYIFIALCSLIWIGCANVVPPTGGPKDETPPNLLSVVPADSALNLKPKKITLRFDKYMEVHDLERQMQLSPLIAVNPTVISYGKRVEIKITDSLLTPNTTYKLSLGNALVDNRESNPYKNFTYIFSTGNYFDSLKLNGSVIDALTGLPDSSATVVLYEAGINDSAVFRKKPVYATKVNSTGKYTLELLPNKNYRIIALFDKDNNYLFDPKDDKIGFMDSLVTPAFIDDSMIVDSVAPIYVFKEDLPTDSTEVSTPENTTGRSGASSRSAARSGGKDDLGYSVKVDTSNKERRSFELTEDLRIDLFKKIKQIDSAKIYLSYEQNEIEIESPHTLTGDTAHLNLKTKWFPDKVYTLRLVKGWAIDTGGAELPPGKYIFRTKQDEDYARLRINVSSEYYGQDYVLFIYKEKDTVHLKPVTDTTIMLTLLQPGNYGMRIIIDKDRDGKWTTGNYLDKRHPEKVIPFLGQIVLKAGWENETDFMPPVKKSDIRSEEEEE